MIVKSMIRRMVLIVTTGCSIACAAGASAMTSNVTSFGPSKYPGRTYGVHPLRLRARREALSPVSQLSGFTHDEASQLLRKHNEYRAMQNASNMLFMEWNDDLQRLAQNLANKCDCNHSPKSYRTNIGGFKSVGENLYCANYKFNVTRPVRNWYIEINNYNYESKSPRCKPKKKCGHYTQVVWHHSYALGCGVHYCDKMLGAGKIKYGYLVVCHYGLTGNYAYARPFKKGKPCTECKGEFPYCVRGMCSKRPQIGSLSTRLMPEARVIAFTLSLLITLKTITSRL